MSARPEGQAPSEDPTGRGSLQSLAKQGIQGAQVLADKMSTPSETNR